MGPTSLDVGGRPVLREGDAICVLQWGRHLSMSEGLSIRRGRTDVALQWGRHLSMSEGKLVAVDMRGPLSLLQWGRHLSMSEGHDPRRHVHPSRAASMGPTSLDVGGSSRTAMTGLGRRFNGADISRCRRGSGSPATVTCPWSRFNGADISRCRRGRVYSAHPRRRAHRASMGPTSLDVGGFVLVEIRVTWHRSSFNGADISRCRRDLETAMASQLRAGIELQWGRHLSMSEGRILRDIGWLLVWQRSLQWGRHLSMSEGGVGSRRAARPTCRRFNGADISRCRRVDDGRRLGDQRERALQWGRHLSMSEGTTSSASARAASSGFNGADISRCRRGPARATHRARRLASMGPTSLDVGGFAVISVLPPSRP